MTNWKADLRIKKVLLYYEKLIRNYMRSLSLHEKEEQQTFKKELLDHFKDLDKEENTYILRYLIELDKKLKRKADNTLPVEKRAFIFEFSKKADKLIKKNVMSKYLRILFFLNGFFNKVGNRICKNTKVNIEETSSLKEKQLQRGTQFRYYKQYTNEKVRKHIKESRNN